MFDPTGVARVPAFDFKGNPLSVERQLARDYQTMLDWSALDAQLDYASLQNAAAPSLETADTFTVSSTYDALNRPVELTLYGGTVFRPSYDEANCLAALRAQIEGQGPFIDFLRSQEYNARGQRVSAHYGNDVVSTLLYDPQTFRLTDMLSAKDGDDPATQSLQRLRYTYDPSGNITQIRDDAQQTHFFRNAVVAPEARYEYDALYQLITATGREHAAAANNAVRDASDLPFVPELPHANDAAAVRLYTESYEYDLLGNITRLRHSSGAAVGTWSRRYQYRYQTDPTDATNRLAATTAPGDADPGPLSATYDYDQYGNMTRLRTPTPDELRWTVLDQLRSVDLGGGGTAYYTYSFAGQRMRKVIERQNGQRLERIYLGALEIWREWTGGNQAAPTYERHTIHVADNAGRVAQVDVKTRDDAVSDPDNPLGAPLIRYQFSNHLGSAILETNADGDVITYEEYHPLGTTSYRSSKPGFNLSLKRYRFCRRERDDETGLYDGGARYYAPWLGRWISADPAGFVDGLNLYRYCRNNPIMLVDPSGAASAEMAYPLKDAPAEVRQALTTNTDDARALLDNYMTGRQWTYAGKTYEYTPGSVHWDEAKGKNAGESSEVGPAPPAEEATGEEKAATAPPAGPGEQATPAPPAGGEAKPAPAPGVGEGALSQTAPAVERFIWNFDFPGTGVANTQRGRILEWLYGVPWRDNTKGIDLMNFPAGQSVKSTRDWKGIGGIARGAVNRAADYIAAHPGATAGLRPQAVMITPTDTPASATQDLRTALNPGRGRKIPPNALPTEHVRGLPGRIGAFLRGVTYVGGVLSAYSLLQDYLHHDVWMGIGDAISAAGGALEIYALSRWGATWGAMVLGLGAVSAGLVAGGAGGAWSSGVSGVRAYQANDFLGLAAGIAGVLAGGAIVAGVIFNLPLVFAVGMVTALQVGLFHFVRWSYFKFF